MRAQGSQLLALGAYDVVGNQARSTQQPTLALYDDILVSRFVWNTQGPVLALVQMDVDVTHVPKDTQHPTLALYGEGARENFKARAWEYVQDGHRFYVLHLGDFGTLVYDYTTGQWAEYATEGYDKVWNGEQGLMWNLRIVAGDNQNGNLWEVDPDSELDEEFKPIRRIVTAILPGDNRVYTTVDRIDLDCSVGFPTGDTPAITLSWSDDGGNSFYTPDDGTLTIVAGDLEQEVSWTSLGSFTAPGRIIQFEDVGATVRIDRASIETR